MCTLPIYNLDEMAGEDPVCDLCEGRNLEAAYRPEDTKRGLGVFVCADCGLVQSLPRGRSASTGGGSASLASGGADWGNIRYGKSFRVEDSLEILSRVTDLTTVERCLDIGSNRGGFIKALSRVNSRCEITAVEPDSRIIGEYSGGDYIRLMNERFEDCELPEARFDVAYCCHTLEHVDSPGKMLEKTWKALAPGGVLYLDVPDLNAAAASDFVEEFFIDKHMYHFTQDVLCRYVLAAGFDVVMSDSGDGENIVVVARKPLEARSWKTDLKDAASVELARSLMEDYLANREKAVSGMARVGEFINGLAPGKVAVWGGGRLFDCLMKYGNVREGTISKVVDRYLSEHLDIVHGFRLVHPDELSPGDAEAVVVMSRAYADEIRREAAEALGDGVPVYDYPNLAAGPDAAASNE